MNKKIIAIIVVAAIIITSAILAISSYAKNKKGDSDSTTSSNTSASTSEVNATTLTNTTTTATTTGSTQTTTAKELVTTTTTAKQTTTINKTTTQTNVDSVVVNGTKNSKIIIGEKAAKSWSVKSAASNAYIEKIALNLNVYNNGVKTSKTVKRYGYFAIVHTTNASIYMVDSLHSVNKPVADAVSISKAANALVSVNNEMCNHNAKSFDGFFNAANDQPTATVIKSGIVAQTGESTPSLACHSNGTWEYPVYVSSSNAKSIIASGINNTVGYTYPLIWHGEKYLLSDTGKPSDLWSDHLLDKSSDSKQYYNDHTVVGQVDANTYIFAVSEGFGQAYLAEYMLNDLGVQNAYWCNGGHCSLMYVKGYGAINRPTDHHLCKAADIICVK